MRAALKFATARRVVPDPPSPRDRSRRVQLSHRARLAASHRPLDLRDTRLPPRPKPRTGPCAPRAALPVRTHLPARNASGLCHTAHFSREGQAAAAGAVVHAPARHGTCVAARGAGRVARAAIRGRAWAHGRAWAPGDSRAAAQRPRPRAAGRPRRGRRASAAGRLAGAHARPVYARALHACAPRRQLVVAPCSCQAGGAAPAARAASPAHPARARHAGSASASLLRHALRYT